jgi:peptidoglycan/LPS O-acetylase OafA/YrhL
LNGPIQAQRLYDILWLPISPFWFLYALFFCNVFGFLLRKMRPEIVVAIALVSFAISFALVPVVNDITYGFFYFSLGIWGGRRDWLRSAPTSWKAVALLTAFFLLTAFGCYFCGVPERMPVPCAILGVAATISLCSAMERTRLSQIVSEGLGWIGQCSMSIYVMHILVLASIRTFLIHGLHVYSVPVLMLAGIPAAIYLPMLIQVLAAKLKVNTWVGLPTSATIVPSPAPKV